MKPIISWFNCEFEIWVPLSVIKWTLECLFSLWGEDKDEQRAHGEAF